MDDSVLVGLLVHADVRVGPGWHWNGDTGAPAFSPVARSYPQAFGGKGPKGDPGDGGESKVALAKISDFASDPSALIGSDLMIPILLGPPTKTLSQAVAITSEFGTEPDLALFAVPEESGLRIICIPKDLLP